jgi:hypothetical protein
MLQPVKREKIMVLVAGDTGTHYLISGRHRHKFHFVNPGVISLRITDRGLWDDIGKHLQEDSVDVLLPKNIPSTELNKYDIILKERLDEVVSEFSVVQRDLKDNFYNNIQLPSIFDYYRFCELYNKLIGKGIYIHYDNMDGKSGEDIDEYIELLEKFRDVYENFLKLKPALLSLEDTISVEDIKKIKDEYEANL